MTDDLKFLPGKQVLTLWADWISRNRILRASPDHVGVAELGVMNPAEYEAALKLIAEIQSGVLPFDGVALEGEREYRTCEQAMQSLALPRSNLDYLRQYVLHRVYGGFSPESFTAPLFPPGSGFVPVLAQFGFTPGQFYDAALWRLGETIERLQAEVANS